MKKKYSILLDDSLELDADIDKLEKKNTILLDESIEADNIIKVIGDFKPKP